MFLKNVLICTKDLEIFKNLLNYIETLKNSEKLYKEFKKKFHQVMQTLY